MGELYGRWNVLDKPDESYWLCKCRCGLVKPVKKSHLLSGVSKSCGCLRKDILSEEVGEKNRAWKARGKERPQMQGKNHYNWKGGKKLTDQASMIKTKYGLTLEEYLTMLVLQNSQCYICRVDFKNNTGNKNPGLAPHVDHCHKTGKNRKLLCKKCNSGLGSFRDDPILMKKGLDYLIEHGA